MNQMQRDIDEAFRSFGMGRLLGPGFGAGFGLRDWPRINLREDADHVYVEALLPGVDPDKIDMNVLGNTLTLSGERAALESEKNSRTWHRRERGAGKFLRSIELPVEGRIPERPAAGDAPQGRRGQAEKDQHQGSLRPQLKDIYTRKGGDKP
jgi:HSP20 family protein